MQTVGAAHRQPAWRLAGKGGAGPKKPKAYKISYRLRIVLLLQAVVLLAGYFLLLLSYQRNARQQQDSAIYQINYTILANTGYAMQTLQITTQFPLLRSHVKFEDPLIQFLNAPQMIEESPPEFSRVFENRVSEILHQFPVVDSIFLFGTQGDLYAYKTTDLYYQPIGDSVASSWREEVLAAKGSMIILSDEQMQEIGCKPNSGVLYGGRMLADTNHFRPLCIAVVGIKISDVVVAFNAQKQYAQQEFAIYNRSGVKLFGEGETELDPSCFTGPVVKNSILELEGNCYHISYDFDSQLYSVVETPLNILNSRHQRAGMLFKVAGLLIISSNLLIFGLIIKSITSPLRRLVEACRRMGDGDFSTRVETGSADELGFLTDSFNQMTGQVEKLINEVYLRNLTERDLELQMLRSQINPHFLYNTLESMRMLAFSQGFGDLAEMCRLLGDVLRYGVTLPSHSVTVREELDQLQKYIALLEYRFRDQIQVYIHVDEGMMELYTLKLLLQPVVENCINHGLAGLQKVGEIRIWGYRQEGRMVFNVADNGTGMDEGTLVELVERLDDASNSHKSIGLRNIHRRIRLIYGEEYGVRIESREGAGTSVTIVLPIREIAPEQMLPAADQAEEERRARSG